jgi:hypothetical protein
LLILLAITVLYLFKHKKDVVKSVCVNEDDEEIESGEHKQIKNINSERVFVGRFVTDEEYQQMIKGRRSDISTLMEEVNKEYEHLKELSK